MIFYVGIPEEYLAMVNNWLLIQTVSLRSSLNKLFMSATPHDTTKLVVENLGIALLCSCKLVMNRQLVYAMDLSLGSNNGKQATV
jgi:hypothetical protein